MGKKISKNRVVGHGQTTVYENDLVTDFFFFLSLFYYSVVENMRLMSGLLWSMPITLDVNEEEIKANQIQPQRRIALLDPRDYEPLAILTVEDVYQPNKAKEAEHVFGADDSAHPAVYYLHNVAKKFNVGGTLEAIQSPSHYDYVANRCKSVKQKKKYVVQEYLAN
jgi:ATP sulfurylase